MVKTIATSLIELSGFTALTYGVFLIADWLGFIVLGLVLLFISYALGSRGTST